MRYFLYKKLIKDSLNDNKDFACIEGKILNTCEMNLAKEKLKSYIDDSINSANSKYGLCNSIIYGGDWDNQGKCFYLLRPNINKQETIHFIFGIFAKSIKYTFNDPGNLKSYINYSFDFWNGNDKFANDVLKKVKKQHEKINSKNHIDKNFIM